ncbi:MAG: oligosaccharide flippase family protein [Chromatiales bacterium]|nr:oligosaccharide flippase family protein [Chromatiales bacterium]
MLVQAVTQVGVLALLARFLAPEDFGLMAAANIVITLVQMIAEGGVGSAVVQRANLTQSFTRVAVSVSLLISAACFVMIGLLAVPFEALLAMDRLAPVVLVLGAGIFLYGLASLLEGLLQRDLRFQALFRVNLAGSIAGYALPAVVLALMGAGVWALVIATLGRVVVKLALMVFMYEGRLWPGWERGQALELFHFGFGLTQDRFWNWVSMQTAPFAIGLLFGQAQLGQFYMGSQLAVLPFQYLSTIASTVYFPIASRSVTDGRSAITPFLMIIMSAFVFATGVGFTFALNSDLLVTVVFGPGWDQAITVFQILCLGAGIRSCIQLCDSLNIARGDVYALANRRAATALFMLVGMYLAQDLGLAGAAWAVMASHALMLALTISLAVRGLQIRRAEIAPVVRRVIMAFLMLVAANLPVWYLRESGPVGGVALLGWSIVTNAVLLLPLTMVLFDRVRNVVLRRLGHGISSKVS